jgi:hypothetical protein
MPSATWREALSVHRCRKNRKKRMKTYENLSIFAMQPKTPTRIKQRKVTLDDNINLEVRKGGFRKRH